MVYGGVFQATCRSNDPENNETYQSQLQSSHRMRNVEPSWLEINSRRDQVMMRLKDSSRVSSFLTCLLLAGVVEPVSLTSGCLMRTRGFLCSLVARDEPGAGRLLCSGGPLYSNTHLHPLAFGSLQVFGISEFSDLLHRHHDIYIPTPF
jgi:hypothetical protein